MIKKTSMKNYGCKNSEFIDGAEEIFDRSEKKVKAGSANRIKSFIIDLLIFSLAWFFLRYIAWTPVRCHIWGPLSFTENYVSELKENRAGEVTLKGLLEKYEQKNIDGQRIYNRKINMIEYLMQIILDYPFLLVFFYLTFFWKIKQATPGQLLCGCFVVHEYYDSLDWNVVFKRAILFILSTFFFAGMLYKLIDKKERTFYDLVCDTEVFQYEQ